MAKMIKANRVVEVKDDFVDGYLKRGYDQIGEDGKVEKQATGGKNVTPAEYNKLQAEFDKLQDAYQNLAQENDDYASDAKIYEKENERLENELKKTKQQGNRNNNK